MTKFEVGNRYEAIDICDSEFTFKYEVIARTEKTITIKGFGNKTRKCRIANHSEDHEIVYPEGKYSMCPVLRATRKIQ